MTVFVAVSQFSPDRVIYALRTTGDPLRFVAISVPAALGAAHLIKSFLLETQPNDPGTLALAGAVLLSAAILGGDAPARRASRIDPLAAPRRE